MVVILKTTKCPHSDLLANLLCILYRYVFARKIYMKIVDKAYKNRYIN